VRVTPVSPVSRSARDASMNSTSPPAPVTASPVATPGTLVRRSPSDRLVSGVNLGRPR
jgi:hypothetical protein